MKLEEECETALRTEELIKQPLEVLEGFFKACRSEEDILSFSKRSRSYFGDLFSERLRKEIPEVTGHKIKSGAIRNNSLVRYRCMVQDIFDPEYYAVALKYTKSGRSWKLAKYRENITSEEFDTPLRNDLTSCEESQTLLEERYPTFCVPIPGESFWVRPAPTKSTFNLIPSKNKLRKRILNKQGIESDQLSKREKRARDLSYDTGEKELQNSKTCESVKDMKPWKAVEDDDDFSCIVKFYDKDRVKLNNLVEIVGVISFRPNTSDSKQKELVSCEEVEQVEGDVPCKVPRIHCISSKILDASNHMQIYSHLSEVTQFKNRNTIMKIRQSLISYLLAIFGGDRLTAEYLLLWLVSGRSSFDEHDKRGKLTLALTRCNGIFLSTNLAHVLSTLLPRWKHFHLTLEELNCEPYSPYKNYELNRLVFRKLQLPASTPVLIDETEMTSGSLNENGLQNLQALSKVVAEQTVVYDFTYHKTNWEVDFPTLIIANGRSTLTQGADCVCPLNQHARLVKPPAVYSKIFLEQFRSYIAYIKSLRFSDFDIPDDLTEHIEMFYVESRQKSASINEKDLHRWLTLLRYWELSNGSLQATYEGWDRIQRLEKERNTRLLFTQNTK